jgi:nitrogen-specific signal transduction histidine kinase
MELIVLQAIESLPNALIVYDAAWRIKAFNKQAAQLLKGLGEEPNIALEALITQTIPAAYLLKVPQNPAESRTPCSNQYTTTQLIDGKSQLVSFHLAFNLFTENNEALVYLSITDLSS